MFKIDKEEFEQITTIPNGLLDGAEVILEQRKFDYKKGFPVQSDFYRCKVETRLRAGSAFRILIPNPDFEFPELPPWQMGWIWSHDRLNSILWIRRQK